MPSTTEPLFYVWERSAVYIMGRITGLSGEVVTRLSFDAVSMLITKLPSLGVVTPPTLTVAGVFFDTLQTDARWTKDETGYNFGHMLDGDTYLTDPESTYQLAYLFEPAGGLEKIRRAVRLQPQQIHGLA